MLVRQCFQLAGSMLHQMRSSCLLSTATIGQGLPSAFKIRLLLLFPGPMVAFRTET